MSLSCRTTLDSWRLRWLRLGGFWELQTSWGLCESLSRQVTKAEGMLTALGLIDDTHGPFFLRRACSGWSKVLCSSRTVPSPLPKHCSWTRGSRHPVGRLVGHPLDDPEWRPASPSIVNGAVGPAPPKNTQPRPTSQVCSAATSSAPNFEASPPLDL